MPKFNAIEAISPAAQLTKRNLLPVRWAFWLRMAVLGIATGEMSTSSGCNFNLGGGWPQPQQSQDHFAAMALDPRILAAIPILIASALILMLLWMYISSVSRFVLFEAVLNGQVSIREAFGRWKDQGARFFGFQLIMLAALLIVVGLVVGVMVMTVGVAALKGSAAGGMAALGAVLFALLALFIVFIPYMIIFVLAKDFAVPIMALEGSTFREGWRRTWAMVKSEFGSVAGYLGMKLVLAVAAGIVFGIAIIIILLILAIPAGALGFGTFFALKSAGLSWNVFTVSLAVVGIAIAVSVLVFLIAFITVPVTNFFPAYGLMFLAGRYQPLHDRLFPPPPPPTIVEPEPTPEPPPDIPPPEPITG